MSKPYAVSQEHIDALIRYSARHGRSWKSDLMSEWLHGLEFTRNGMKDGALLHQVRNWLGPKWLERWSLKKAIAAKDEAYKEVAA